MHFRMADRKINKALVSNGNQNGITAYPRSTQKSRSNSKTCSISGAKEWATFQVETHLQTEGDMKGHKEHARCEKGRSKQTMIEEMYNGSLLAEGKVTMRHKISKII